MTSPSPKLRRDALPCGLIGAVAMILAVESFIVHHKLDTMDPGLWTYESAREKMAENVKDARVLCFGDSLVKHGVAPKILEAKAGLKGYNLAIPGSPPPASYLLFRRAIEAGARPEAVVVDYFPCLMNTDPWPNITNWPFVATYADIVELAWQARDPNLFASLTLRKTVPSVACREAIRVNLLLAFKGMAEFNRLGILFALRSWEANRGLAIAGYRCNPNIDIKVAAAPLFSDVRCSPLNQHYIDRFMKLAADYKVRVFWVLPPYMPMLQNHLEQNGFDVKHEALVRRMMDRYPGLSVVDGRHANYSMGAFIDTHHLAFSGAHIYSEELATVIRNRLDGRDPASAWIKLPKYQEHPPYIRHEISEESQAIVLQEIHNRKRR